MSGFVTDSDGGAPVDLVAGADRDWPWSLFDLAAILDHDYLGRTEPAHHLPTTPTHRRTP